MRSYRVEIWDPTNSTRLAIFVDLLELARHRVLKAEETLSLTVALNDPAAEHLSQGNVLRVQRLGEATDFTLWRLAEQSRERDAQDATLLRVSAYALWMDFRQGLVRQAQADGRALVTFGLTGMLPSELLDEFILPGYAGTSVTFEAGSVEAAIDLPLTLMFERTPPLAALRMIEAAAADGVGCEALFRLNASGTGYFVDLLERVGRAAGGAELRYRKNVLGLARLVEERNIETRLYAFGGGLLTLADASWTIDSIASGVILFDGGHPVFEDSAFVGLWFYVDGEAYPITASDAGAGTITVNQSGLPALAAGDVGYIATAIDGTRLDYLESPAAVADYDVRVGVLDATDVPDASNLLGNGDFSAWTGSVPDDWTLEGTPIVADSTDPTYVQHGGHTAHVTADADEGLVSDAVTVPSDERRPYTGLLAGLTVISGRVRLELRHSNGQTYPIAQQPQNEGIGVYLTLAANAHDEPLPAGTVQLAIVAHGGAAEFYVDCAMVTPLLAAAVPAFIATSGARVLWDRTIVELADRRRPRIEYRADIIDLYHADPDAFQFEEIELGDDVKVRDPAIGQETQRVVELDEDLLTGEATSLVVAPSVRERVADPHRPQSPSISGGIGTGGARAPEAPQRPQVLHHVAQYDQALGQLFIPFVANAKTATVQLRTKATRPASYPTPADDSISDRSGVFGGIVTGPNDPLFYGLTALDGAGVPGVVVEGAFNAPEAVVVTPDPFGAVSTYVGPAGELLFNAHGNDDGVSFRWAASKTALPSTPATTVNAREGSAIDTGLTLTEGETGYVAVWWYPAASGGGAQGRRVGDQVERPAAGVGGGDAEVRQYVWAFTQFFTHRGLDVSIHHTAGVASIEISYVDNGDPAPDPSIFGSYTINVGAGPATIVERLKESDGSTVQEWPFGVGRPDVSITVIAYDGAGGTGTILGQDQIIARQDEGIEPVITGGTGLAELTAGALVVGAGTDPVVLLEGASAGQVPRWTGSAFEAGDVDWSDIASIPSSFTPAAHAASHASGGSDAIAISMSQVSGNLPSSRISGSIGIQNGGTGLSISPVLHSPMLLYYDGDHASSLTPVVIPIASGQVLQASGGVPFWSTLAGTLQTTPGPDWAGVFYQVKSGGGHGWGGLKFPLVPLGILEGRPLVGNAALDGVEFGSVDLQYSTGSLSAARIAAGAFGAGNYDMPGRLTFSANAGSDAASIFRNAVNGVMLRGYGASHYSWYLTNELGQGVMRNPVGSQDVFVVGDLDVGGVLSRDGTAVSLVGHQHDASTVFNAGTVSPTHGGFGRSFAGLGATLPYWNGTIFTDAAIQDEATRKYLSVQNGALAWNTISGTVPAPAAADVGAVMQAMGTGTFGWSNMILPTVAGNVGQLLVVTAVGSRTTLSFAGVPTHTHSMADVTTGSLPWSRVSSKPAVVAHVEAHATAFTRIQNRATPYGSIEITGGEGSYAGIHFAAANYTLMFGTGNNIQGAYDHTLGDWRWYFHNGVLTVGSVPASRITAGTFGAGIYRINGAVHVSSSGLIVPVNSGQVAISSSGNSPFYSFHDATGERLSYIQALEPSGILRIRTHYTSDLYIDLDDVTRLRVTNVGDVVMHSTSGVLHHSLNSSRIHIAGGVSGDSGANLVLYGPSHTLAGLARIRSGTVAMLDVWPTGNVMVGYPTDQGYRHAVNGAQLIAGSQTVGGSLTVAGGTTLSGTLRILDDLLDIRETITGGARRLLLSIDVANAKAIINSTYGTGGEYELSFQLANVELMALDDSGLTVNGTAHIANALTVGAGLNVSLSAVIGGALTVGGAATFNGSRVDVEGELYEQDARVAKIIISTAAPSGSHPHGTIWARYT